MCLILCLFYLFHLLWYFLGRVFSFFFLFNRLYSNLAITFRWSFGRKVSAQFHWFILLWNFFKFFFLIKNLRFQYRSGLSLEIRHELLLCSLFFLFHSFINLSNMLWKCRILDIQLVLVKWFFLKLVFLPLFQNSLLIFDRTIMRRDWFWLC